MARILRGVKSPLASSAGGGWSLFLFPFPCSLGRSSLQAVSLSPCGAFLAVFPWGIFRTVQFLALLGLCFGLYGLFSCRVWVSLGAVAFGALRGLLRLLFFLPACRVHLQGEKSPFLPLVCFACLVSASLSVCVSIHARKAALFVGRSFSCGYVWFLLSELEHGKRCGLSAVYLYFVGLVVGFNPSGGGTCNIIKICFVCGLGSAFAVVNGCGFHGIVILGG